MSKTRYKCFLKELTDILQSHMQLVKYIDTGQQLEKSKASVSCRDEEGKPKKAEDETEVCKVYIRIMILPTTKTRDRLIYQS